MMIDLILIFTSMLTDSYLAKQVLNKCLVLIWEDTVPGSVQHGD